MRSPFLIMGDVNVDMLSGDASCEQLKAILDLFACSNVITQPTRLTTHKATLLDVSITNAPSQTCTSGILPLDVSDHLPIFTFLPLDSDRGDSSEKPCYRRMNSDQLNEFYHVLETTQWNFVYAEKDPDKAYCLFP